MPTNPESLDKFLGKIYAEPPACKGMAPDALRELIYNCTGTAYQEKTTSRPHQLEGTAFALYMRRAFLFYWMRLGKTKMALDWAAHLKRANMTKRKGLILAHAAVGVTVWESEVSKHSELIARSVRTGPNAANVLVDALASECDLIIISRHTVQELFTVKRPNRKGKMTLYPNKEVLADTAEFFDYVVIDETHFYSGEYGLPFALASALIARCEFRIGLTGTPVGRDPYVLWAQAHLIDGGEHFGYNYRFFEEAFGKWKYSHFMPDNKVLVFDKDNLDLFQYKLNSFSIAYGKGEIKTAKVESNIIRLKMSVAQRNAYNDTTAKLLNIRIEDEQAVKSIFHKLRQIASGYFPFSDEEGRGRIVHFDSAKLDWLAATVAEIPAKYPCVIFHEYIHSGVLIAKTLKAAGVTYSELRGGTANKDGAVEAFRSGKAQFLVANTVSGGAGIDLPETEYLLFFESPVDPRVREQAAARPMARALDHGLLMDDLVCAPVEEKVLGFIEEGRNLLQILMSGGKKTAETLFSRG